MPARYAHSCKGVSLIELMIAMALGLLLLAGILQIFIYNKQSYSSVVGMSHASDSGRLAIQLISIAVGKAGYWGNVTFNRNYGRDISVTSGTYTGVFDESAYVFGSDNDASAATVVDGTDQLWLRYNGNDNEPFLTCLGTLVTGSQVAIEHYFIQPASGTEKMPSLACEVIMLNINPANGAVTAPATASVNSQTMMTGIENMQILYGQYNTGKSQVRYLNAGDVTDWDLVDNIRIALISASPSESNTVIRTADYELLDEIVTAPQDRFSRQVFERSMSLRNPNL